MEVRGIVRRTLRQAIAATFVVLSAPGVGAVQAPALADAIRQMEQVCREVTGIPPGRDRNVLEAECREILLPLLIEAGRFDDARRVAAELRRLLTAARGDSFPAAEKLLQGLMHAIV